MSCTPAPCCKAALNEATTIAPARSKASDGVCASPDHSAQNPGSDHETGDAFDLTHHPEAGCNVDELFDRIIARRDPRVKYLIRSRRILRSYDKPGIPAWTWAPYTGSNPHIKHGHCSILLGARDDLSPWFTQGDNDMALSPEDKQWITDLVWNTTGERVRTQITKDGEVVNEYLKQVIYDIVTERITTLIDKEPTP